MSDRALRDGFGDYLVELGKNNKQIIVIDGDLSSSTRTIKFANKYPKRFFNMGVAEQNMVGTAMGFAISGKIPIVSGFSVFLTGRAWEFIRIVAHDNLNVKFVPTHSGLVGEDGSTHHALEDLSIMSALPNMTILSPLDENELKQMLDYVVQNDGPFYIRLPRGSFPKIRDNSNQFSIRKPEILKEGEDICLIGIGYGSILAFQSALNIEKKLKISIRVVNLPTIKPINENLLVNQVKNSKGVVVIEEHNIYCGLGSVVSRIFSEKHPIRMKFIGINDTFCQSGTRESLLEYYGLNEKHLLEEIKQLIS